MRQFVQIITVLFSSRQDSTPIIIINRSIHRYVYSYENIKLYWLNINTVEDLWLSRFIFHLQFLYIFFSPFIQCGVLLRGLHPQYKLFTLLTRRWINYKSHRSIIYQSIYKPSRSKSSTCWKESFFFFKSHSYKTTATGCSWQHSNI